ncbi:MAG: substrate-binding domain-containing protein [Propionibacteriaceae bacterium]|nr:substrate-binding domain-containing protein [Propionibacteriaceae bacterium]
MRKMLAAALGVVLALTLSACGGGGGDGGTTPPTDGSNPPPAAGNTIYVLGPTPDHGWTAQAGVYAQQEVDKINQDGKYKAQYMASSSGEAQNDIVNTILANGDAAGVVFMALDDSAKSGQEALISAGIPFISFDRIITGPDASAILNYSGDNWSVGAGIAYWLQKNGMKAGDTLVTLIGDNGTVSSRRQEGFEQFLLGTRSYTDQATGQTYNTTETWTQDQIDALTATYKVVCNWSADTASQYLDQTLPDIVKSASASGSLYVFSMDDEMTFGFLNLLQGNSLDDATRASLQSLNVYSSAIGGMQELYDVMLGKSDLSSVADQYFDGMMSMSFSPKMMITAIDYMVQYLDGGNWSFKVGDGAYEPTFIVDKANASQYQGFTGH